MCNRVVTTRNPMKTKGKSESVKNSCNRCENRVGFDPEMPVIM